MYVWGADTKKVGSMLEAPYLRVKSHIVVKTMWIEATNYAMLVRMEGPKKTVTM